VSTFKLISAIQSLAGVQNDDTVRLLNCTVKTVDLPNRICVVESVSGQSAIEFEALLQAAVGDGLLIEPAVGSAVNVLFSKYTLPTIVSYSDVVTYALNGDEFGGLVKLDILLEKINAIEAAINKIIAWGATVTPPLTTVTQIVPTNKQEIENPTIKHGS